MNKIQILVNVILVAAVATLFALHFSNKSNESTPTETASQAEVMPVA